MTKRDHCVSAKWILLAGLATTITTAFSLHKETSKIRSVAGKSEKQLLIITATRANYLQRCLDTLLIHHPRHTFPITISQHGNNTDVQNVIEKFRRSFQARSSLPVRSLHFEREGAIGYTALSAHYAVALGAVFSDPFAEFVIVLEEDLIVAPDFFEFFSATALIYAANPLIMAVSGWNDNGFSGRVKNSSQLYLSDFFPGLGWMMHRRIWIELGSRWPSIYWDDWMRAPEQRKSRLFIRPEVCRTLHIGMHGVSNHQFGGYLTKIQLNDKYVPFTKLDLSYIASSQAWERVYFSEISKALTVPSLSNLTSKWPSAPALKFFYKVNGSADVDSFARAAQQFGLMPDWKFGVPRTAYKGIVSFWEGDTQVHLVPNSLRTVLG